MALQATGKGQVGGWAGCWPEPRKRGLMRPNSHAILAVVVALPACQNGMACKAPTWPLVPGPGLRAVGGRVPDL
jgi:hypothetical protein